MTILEEIVEDKKVVEEPNAPAAENSDEKVEEAQNFSEMLNQTFVNTDKIVEGDVVEGKIIAINDDYIFVSLGGKHEAYAEVEDYKSKAGKLKLTIGDNLKGFVVKKTDSEIVISRSLNRKYVDKSFLRNAYQEKLPIKGKMISTIRGGFSVELLGTRAFCPFAQSDTRFVSDPSSMIGNYYDFIITEISGDMKNIIVSRKILLEQEIDKQKKETLSQLNVGDVVTGTISRIADFGAFVDLGGIDGLLHISQLSWVKVDSPKDVVSLGEKVQIKVINISGEKISLSMKELQSNPLEKAMEELQVGDVVDCRILRNESFGSFCELKPGVEGLIPISEMIHTGRLNNPSELFTVGDLVSAQIIRMMKPEKKISLSVKALKDDPWLHIEEHINESDEIEGIIDGITNFGIFVRLKEGLVGLLPKSRMLRSSTKYNEDDMGKSITVRISQIDKDKKRISLEPLDAAPQQEYQRSFNPDMKDRDSGRDSGRDGGRDRDRYKDRDRDRKRKQDWRKYAVSKQEVPEDNPFSDL